MTATGPATPAPAPPPNAPRALRRSSTDRYAAGVCGGLGEFFGVDPVIFRVLFVATTFVGGVGVVAYLAAWLAVPESGAANSSLDRWIASVRARGVPLWALILIAAVLLWAALFSWWSPLHLVPIITITAVLTVAAISLLRRERRAGPPPASGPLPAYGPTAPPPGPAGPPPGPYYAATSPMPAAAAPTVAMAAEPSASTVDLSKATTDDDPTTTIDGLFGAPAGDTTVLPGAAQSDAPPAGAMAAGATAVGATSADAQPPLPPATAQLRDWWEQEQGARSSKARRGRITEIAAHSVLFLTWFVLAMVSFSQPIAVQAFLWTGFAILLAAMIIGAILRRPRWRLMVGVVFMSIMLIAVGNYPVRIGDPTGQRDLTPTTVSDIKPSYPMLAGEQLLNFDDVNFDGSTVDVTVEQGAGHMKITVPSDVNVYVDARQRFGELVVFGDTYTGVQNRHQESYLALTDVANAGTLRLDLSLVAGQLEVVRG